MRARRLTVALVAATAALGVLPFALAAETATVTPTVEGWFQPNPSCTTPVGCLAVPGGPTELTVFPAGTMHVGVSGGVETARSYLGLPREALADLSGATLEVPLDPSPSSGTITPETAKLQVCLTGAPLAHVEGSLADPPAADCGRSAPVAYVATPAPHLEADLDGLLSGLSSASGLALLPDAEALAPGDSWRVVFSSKDRTDAAKTAPATLTVERDASAAAPEPAPAAEQPAAVPAAPEVQGLPAEDLPPVPDLEPELGSAPVPAVVEEVALEAGPQAAPEQALPVEQVGFPETVQVGYAYPGVWLLPLGLLVVVPLVARVLTRDLTPRDDQDAPEA